MKSNALKAALAFSWAALAPVASWAQLSADYTDSSGDWSIVGTIIGPGNTIACKMQKAAENSFPFAYLDMLSVGRDGIESKALFVTQSKLPEGSTPAVTLFFDGVKQTPLSGGVNGGYLHIDLDAHGIDELKHLLDLFQFTSELTEVANLRGHPSETTKVDLAHSDTAFDKAGLCMKVVMRMGMGRMQENSGQ